MKEFFPYPSALFRIGNQYKWKVRFLVGLGYLYALCHENDIASTSYKELENVMVTRSSNRVGEVLKQLEYFNSKVNEVLISSGRTKSLRLIIRNQGRNKGTVLSYLSSHDLTYFDSNNLLFPVPKLAFLLPVSAQAKAVYIYLWYLKAINYICPGPSFRKIAKSLRINRKGVSEYISELENLEILRVSKSRFKKEYHLKSPEDWSADLLRKIEKIYGKNHPFLVNFEYNHPIYERKKPIYLTIRFESEEQLSAAIVILKEYFGQKIKVYKSNLPLHAPNETLNKTN